MGVCGYADGVGSGSNGGDRCAERPGSGGFGSGFGCPVDTRVDPAFRWDPEDPDASPDCLSRDEEKPECTIELRYREWVPVWVLGSQFCCSPCVCVVHRG